MGYRRLFGKKKPHQRDDRGFTLVELIVVLVVLAILAAVLIPALLGYIDLARQKQYILHARSCMQAAQAELTELYAKSDGKTTPGEALVDGVVGTSTSGNKDYDVTNSDFAKKILKTADMTGDKEPYCFMIAVGSNSNQSVNGGASAAKIEGSHAQYTVYYAFYQETQSAPPLYYYNREWTKVNPRANNGTEVFDSNNTVKFGPDKGIRLQYYLISNKTGKGSIDSGTFWKWLKDMN